MCGKVLLIAFWVFGCILALFAGAWLLFELFLGLFLRFLSLFLRFLGLFLLFLGLFFLFLFFLLGLVFQVLLLVFEIILTLVFLVLDVADTGLRFQSCFGLIDFLVFEVLLAASRAWVAMAGAVFFVCDAAA